MSVCSALAYLGMPPGQEEGVRVADFCLDNTKITGSIEQAGIPAFPVRQQFFNPITKCHRINVYDDNGRDNDRAAGI
jgi:hypothetical protein